MLSEYLAPSDPVKEVMKYHTKMHVLGNSPLPAVVIYGL